MDEEEEDKDDKRTNKVKTDKQNSQLLKLYIQKKNWSKKFMNKMAIKLKLKPVQMYKWRWDRQQSEKRVRDRLKLMSKLPDQVFYITKIKRKSVTRGTTKTVVAEFVPTSPF